MTHAELEKNSLPSLLQFAQGYEARKENIPTLISDDAPQGDHQ